MGRRKIAIQPILDERNRSVTFNKRRAGLFKKAYELGTLCGAEIAVIVFSSSGKCYEYSSGQLDDTLIRYSRMSVPPVERKGPADFGGAFPHPANAVAQNEDEEEEDSDGERNSANVENGRAYSPFPRTLPPMSMTPGFLPPMHASYPPHGMHPGFPSSAYPPQMMHPGHASSLPMLQHASDSYRPGSMHPTSQPGLSYPSLSHADMHRSVTDNVGSVSSASTPQPQLSKVTAATADLADRHPIRLTQSHPQPAPSRRGSAPVLPSSSRSLSNPSGIELAPIHGVPDSQMSSRSAGGEDIVDEEEIFVWPTYDRDSGQAPGHFEGHHQQQQQQQQQHQKRSVSPATSESDDEGPPDKRRRSR